jgi:hypothetical protein
VTPHVSHTDLVPGSHCERRSRYLNSSSPPGVFASGGRLAAGVHRYTYCSQPFIGSKIVLSLTSPALETMGLSNPSPYPRDDADAKVLGELLPAFLCDRNHPRIPARNGRTIPSRPSC